MKLRDRTDSATEPTIGAPAHPALSVHGTVPPQTETYSPANPFVGSNECQGSTPSRQNCWNVQATCEAFSQRNSCNDKREKKMRPKPPKGNGSNTRKRRREEPTKIRTAVLCTLHENHSPWVLLHCLANKLNINPSYQLYKSSGVRGSSNWNHSITNLPASQRQVMQPHCRKGSKKLPTSNLWVQHKPCGNFSARTCTNHAVSSKWWHVYSLLRNVPVG